MIQDLHNIWGTWNKRQPPKIGSPALLEIARQEKPLMIFDPLRMGHGAKENDSDEMSLVMEHLRSYAAAGAAVVFIHHIAKTEGSNGRGSTAIFDACDRVFVQEIQPDGKILLRCEKNRFGPKDRWTLLPDWARVTFTVTDSSESKKLRADNEKLLHIITQNPGICITTCVRNLGWAVLGYTGC